MSLPQAEADLLLAMPKVFSGVVIQIELPRSLPFSEELDLEGVGTRERFILDLERGNLKRTRLKYQTRARKIYVLARLDLDGRPHRNPPDSPHRPSHRFNSHHLHLYRENFNDRIAFLPQEVTGFQVPTNPDAVRWLIAFLRFCNVQTIPQIQENI
jgi:hypothetical protein